jgi:hypothetical protein
MRSYFPKTLTNSGTDEGTIFTVVMLSGNMIPYESRTVEDMVATTAFAQIYRIPFLYIRLYSDKAGPRRAIMCR